MKKATFVEHRDGKGAGAVFKLSHKLEGHKYVWVSAVVVPFSGPETYIFGWNPQEEEVASWSELGGSFQGALDIPQALRNAGYEVIGYTK